jgi:hypothetical protein
LKQKRIPSPQHAPAAALLELVTEHPELRVAWSLGDDGLLMGNVRVEADGRAVMDRIVAVLGGTPVESQYAAPGDPSDLMWSSWVWTTWRDVQLSVTVSCPAMLADASEPVSGLPVKWSAAVTA